MPEADNIGTLSVDVTAATDPALKALEDLETRLGELAATTTTLKVDLTDIERIADVVIAANAALKRLAKEGKEQSLTLELKQNVTYTAETKAIESALKELVAKPYQVNFTIGNLDEIKGQLTGLVIPFKGVLESIDAGDVTREVHIRGTSGSDSGGGSAQQSQARDKIAEHLTADAGKAIDDLFKKLTTALQKTDQPMAAITDHASQLIEIQRRFGSNLVDPTLLGANREEAKIRGATGAFGTESDLAKLLPPATIRAIQQRAAPVQRDILNAGTSAGSTSDFNFREVLEKVATESSRPPRIIVREATPATTAERHPATGPASLESLIQRTLRIAEERKKGSASYEPIGKGVEMPRAFDLNKLIGVTVVGRGNPRHHGAQQFSEAEPVFGGDLDPHGKLMNRTGSRPARRGRNIGLQARTEPGIHVHDLLAGEQGEEIAVTSRARSTQMGKGSELVQAQRDLARARAAQQSYNAEREEIGLALGELWDENPNPAAPGSSVRKSAIRSATIRAKNLRGAAEHTRKAEYDSDKVKIMEEDEWKVFNKQRAAHLDSMAEVQEKFAADLESGKASPELHRPNVRGDLAAKLVARRNEINQAMWALVTPEEIDTLGVTDTGAVETAEGLKGEPVPVVRGTIKRGGGLIRDLEQKVARLQEQEKDRSADSESAGEVEDREARESQTFQQDKRYGPLRGGGVDLIQLQQQANLGFFDDKIWVRNRQPVMQPVFDEKGEKTGEEPVMRTHSSDGVKLKKPVALMEDVLQLRDLTPKLARMVPNNREVPIPGLGHVKRANAGELFKMAAGRVAASQGVGPEVGERLVEEDLAKRGLSKTTRTLRDRVLHHPGGFVGDVGARVTPTADERARAEQMKDSAFRFRSMMSDLRASDPEEYASTLAHLRLQAHEMAVVGKEATNAANKASRDRVEKGRTDSMSATQLSTLFQQHGKDPLEVLQTALTRKIGIQTGVLPDPRLITGVLDKLAYSDKPLRDQWAGYMPERTEENPYPTYQTTGLAPGALLTELQQVVGDILREYGGEEHKTTDFSKLGSRQLEKLLRKAKTPLIEVEGSEEPLDAHGLGYLADMIVSTEQFARENQYASSEVRPRSRFPGLGVGSDRYNDRRRGLGASTSQPAAELGIHIPAQEEYTKKRRKLLHQFRDPVVKPLKDSVAEALSRPGQAIPIAPTRETEVERPLSTALENIDKYAEGTLIGKALPKLFENPEDPMAVAKEIARITKVANDESGLDPVAGAAYGSRNVAQAMLNRIERVKKRPSYVTARQAIADPMKKRLEESAEAARTKLEAELLNRAPKPEGIFYTQGRDQITNQSQPGQRVLPGRPDDAARFLLDPDVEEVLASFGRSIGPGAGAIIKAPATPEKATGIRAEVGRLRARLSRSSTPTLIGWKGRDLTEAERASITPDRPEGLVGPVRPSIDAERELRATFQPPSGKDLLEGPESENWTDRQRQIARDLVIEKDDRGGVARYKGIGEILQPKRDRRDPGELTQGEAHRRASIDAHPNAPQVGSALEQPDPTRAPAELAARHIVEPPARRITAAESAIYAKAQRDLVDSMEVQTQAHEDLAKYTDQLTKFEEIHTPIKSAYTAARSMLPGGATHTPGLLTPEKEAELQTAAEEWAPRLASGERHIASLKGKIRAAKSRIDEAPKAIEAAQSYIESLEGIYDSTPARDSTYVNPRFLAGEEGGPASARSPMREQAGGGGGGFPSRMEVIVMNWPEALLSGAIGGGASAGGGGGSGKPPAPPEGPDEEGKAGEEDPKEDPRRRRIIFRRPIRTVHSEQEKAITRAPIEEAAKRKAEIDREQMYGRMIDTVNRPLDLNSKRAQENARRASDRTIDQAQTLDYDERGLSYDSRTGILAEVGEHPRQRVARKRSEERSLRQKVTRKSERDEATRINQLQAQADFERGYIYDSELGYYGSKEDAPKEVQRKAEEDRRKADAKATAAEKLRVDQLQGRANFEMGYSYDIGTGYYGPKDQDPRELARQAAAAARVTPRGAAFDDTDENIFSIKQAEADEDMRKMRGQMRMAARKVPKRGFGPSVTDLVTGVLGGPGFERQLESMALMERDLSHVNAARMANAKIETKMTTTRGRLDAIGWSPVAGETPQIAAERTTHLAKLAKLTDRYDKNVQAVERSSESFQTNRKVATSFGTVLNSYRAAFVGSAVSVGMGAISTGLGMAVMGPMIASLGEAFSRTIAPALESFMGKESAINASVGAAAQYFTQAQGNAEIAISGYGSSLNLNREQIELATPEITSLASVEASNMKLAEQAGVLQSSINLSRRQAGGRDTSGVSGTSGWQGSPINQIPGVDEILGTQFRDAATAWENDNRQVGWNTSGIFLDDAATRSYGSAGEDVERAVKFWNESLDKVDESTLRFVTNLDGTEAPMATHIDEWRKQVLALREIKATEVANRVEYGGLGIVNEQGMPETDPEKLKAMLLDVSKSASGQDFQTILDTNAVHIRNQYYKEDQSARMALGTGTYHGLGTIESQFGIEMAASPIGSATSGIAKQDLGGQDETKKLYADINAEAEKGVTTAKNVVATWLRGTEFVGQFNSALNETVRLGAEISNIQIGREQVHAEYAAKQYNFQLFQMNRSYRDAINLRKAAFGGGGSGLGGIQGQQWALQRESTSLGFGMSQRQINFQTATAGFAAPGTTAEARAANIQQAKVEAEYAQKQLDIQKKLFGLEGKAFKINVDRSVYDLSRQIDLLTEGREITIDDVKAQKTIKVLNIQMGKEMKIVNQIFGQAQVRANDLLELSVTIANQLTKDAGRYFNQIIQLYKDFYKNLPIDDGKGSKVAQPTTAIGQAEKWQNKDLNKNGIIGAASGIIGMTSGSTTMTIGEAGTETVAVLRNPRNVTPGEISSGGSGVVNFTFINNAPVRNDGDLYAIKKVVLDVLNQKAAMQGLRGAILS